MAKSFLACISTHPYVIVCGAKSELALTKIASSLKIENIRFREFREPDIGNQLTAIATEPIYGEYRKFFKKFQLLK